MALIQQDSINIFALKKIIKEFNDFLNMVRVPNYYSALKFCINPNEVNDISKQIKSDWENQIDDLIDESNGGSNTVVITFPEIILHQQNVDGLQNRVAQQMAFSQFGSPQSMFETQEFLMFKIQLQDKITSLVNLSKTAKENKVAPIVELDFYCKDAMGKLAQFGNDFNVSLSITLYQM